MPEAPPTSPPKPAVAPQAPPAQEAKKDAPKPPEPRKYALKFDPLGEFSETELFVNGTVRGKLWLSERTSVVLRSLSGEEVDRINEAIKITDGMTVTHFNTELTYHNLSFSIEKIADKAFDGTFEEKLKKIRAMAAPVLARLSLAYLEFSSHVDELFAGKGVFDVAKKS